MSINLHLEPLIEVLTLMTFAGLLRELAGGDRTSPEIESKIAFIMAHEVAHVVARHGNEKMSSVNFRSSYFHSKASIPILIDYLLFQLFRQVTQS